MKLTPTITDASGRQLSALTIDKGESIESTTFPLGWTNSDGTARDLTGATLSVELCPLGSPDSPIAGSPVSVSATGQITMLASASAALTRGRYVIRIWEVRGAEKGCAELPLVVD